MPRHFTRAKAQFVDHWRTLIRLVHEREEDGSSICNTHRCPKLTAGPNHTFTWLNSRMQPCPPPPPDWLGKRSGFPENFNGVCQTIFRQMFRVYPHLYWSHFEDTYHLGLEKALNSCFSHFVLTATTLNLLAAEDLVPMQALVDFSAAIGTVPPGSRAHEYARVEGGGHCWIPRGQGSGQVAVVEYATGVMAPVALRKLIRDYANMVQEVRTRKRAKTLLLCDGNVAIFTLIDRASL
ncbi:hypothetical protein P8C59_007790 [Phyllachora maydis]|uniref:Uncharacterized protein n=1 Tax=Phyllachora maydis TaxID=1825666 RepID=A0AAD9I979_9PEZI|nr:hypothetical protein P8C59_007790 [Phyllachora maydis]